MKITPSFHVIPLGIVNAFLLVEDQQLTLIDAGLPKNEQKILKYIAGLGRQAKDLKHLLITHSDGDHIGSAKALRDLTGARIYASAGEAASAAQGLPPREPHTANPLLKLLFSFTAKMFLFPPTSIEVILKEGDTLPMLGGLQVLSTPGHTPDHISFYAPTHQLLIAGDSLRTKNDLIYNEPSPFTWDEAQQNASVAKQAALKPNIVGVGHGKVVQDAESKFK